MTKITLLVLINLTVVLQAFSQELNIEKGSRFAYQVHVTEKGVLKNDKEYTYSFQMLSKDSMGNYRFKCLLEQIKSRENVYADQYSELNTADIRNTTFISTAVLLPLAILQKPFFLTINPKGKIIRIDSIENIVQQAIQKWQLTASNAKMLLGNTKIHPKVEIQELFFDLPENKIRYPSEWLSADKSTKYKVTAIKGALLVIEANSVKTDSDFHKGLCQFNDASGLIETYNLNTKSIVQSTNAKTAPLYIDRTFTQKLIYNIQEYPAVDTAWVNMAIKLSWMSDAVKNGVEYDSVKVFNAFKQYDEKFANDRYYNVTKLSLMQQFHSDKSYLLYDEQLVKTPNHFLIGQESHLFNKLGEVLNTSADSAYAVARYFYKDQAFNEWVQQSYAQAFLKNSTPQKYTEAEKEKMRQSMKERGWNDDEIEQQIRDNENSQFNSFQLLELFNKDHDSLMQQKIHPLYLWVNVKMQKDNNKALFAAANEFKNMSEESLKAGNGGRYALLIYKLLQQADEHKAAASLLNHTIKGLENLVADTLNKERYAHQNILAYAYFLKYQAEEKTGSAEAIHDLSKAASLSPKNKDEKAYSSFYDRVFLESKESYRDYFFSKLFEKGDKEQALKVFIAHINANPDQLKDLQKTYQLHFPGQDFRTFFTERILPSWSLAPDFQLTGINSREYALSDYKGNWLVLDFWGTWCEPCREEMPKLNEFNKELNQEQHRGIAFLSIACSDTKDRVITFFKQKNYSMPSAIADNTVEKNYNIHSYPSKIIISPNGRMINISFGKDWKGIVEQFAALQSGK